MKYTTSYSPATTAFSLMSKGELQAFFDWFMLNLPYHMEELMSHVRSAIGFGGWVPDYSVISLDELGQWLEKKVQRRSLTQNEVDKTLRKAENVPNTAAWDLTEESKSFATLVGIYYGQVAISCNPKLKWAQRLGSRKIADFGQPIVTGPGVVPINPVRIAHSFSCGLVDGTNNGNQLRAAYDYWSNLKMPS